jgi:hypothetical protein
MSSWARAASDSGDTLEGSLEGSLEGIELGAVGSVTFPVASDRGSERKLRKDLARTPLAQAAM